MEFLLTSSYLIRSIAKELEVSPSTISREINNIPRKCIGYKTPKEFYKSYSKCCTSNWNSQGGERFRRVTTSKAGTSPQWRKEFRKIANNKIFLSLVKPILPREAGKDLENNNQ